MNQPAVKLKDVCDFVRGPFGGALKKEFFVEDGYAVYEQQHAIYDQFKSVRYFVDDEMFLEMRRFELRPGDLIMSCSGTMGKVAVVPEGIKRGIINQALLKLTPSNELDISYFKYWMKSASFQFTLSGNTHGAAIKNVASVSILKELEIPLPPLPEQKRIATILDKADAIRRKRQQAIQLADQFLRAVFLDMFGDPVINPKGWTVGTIRDLITSAKYGTSKKAHETDGEYPILRMGNITYEGGWDFSKLKYIDLSDDEKPKYLVVKRDILFNRTNSKVLVGKTAVYEKDQPMAIAGYLIRVRTNEKANPYYISAYLNSAHGKSTLARMCKSIVGMANINAQELQDIKISKPPKELQDKYERIVFATRSNVKKMSQLKDSSHHLFLALSQKAFAGEL